MPLLRTPFDVKAAPVPYRYLVQPLDNVQSFISDRTLDTAFINPYGSGQKARVQLVVRKQAPLLESSKLNTQEHVDWVLEKIPVNKESAVLDLHCGIGIIARAVASSAKKVVGLDISRHLISYAQQRTKENLSYVVGDSSNIPAEDNSFDVVVSRFALNQIEDPDAVLKEVRRVVKPGGYVAFVERVAPAGLPERFRHKMEYLETVRDPSHILFWNEVSLAALFENHGIKRNKIAYTQATESLHDYMHLTNTSHPDELVIDAWMSGNLRSSDPEFEQVTGFNPFPQNEEIWIQHNHIFIGGVKN